MLVELHILQNYAPSCLNRDDTNSPKECEFGGFRRARISSQCIKRSIRESALFQKKVGGIRGVRTKKLISQIGETISGKQDGNEDINKIVADVFNEAGLTADNKNLRTDVLVYIDEKAISQIAQAIKNKLVDLEKGDKDKKKILIEELSDKVETLVKTPDIALFGRMLAIKPDKPLGKRTLNINAACQVAHAISTHKVGREFDFYTAVDDLQKEDETGAGMMGDIEFNSACYYRYANIDLEQLKSNLENDTLAYKAVEAFICAAISAIPSGKQTSFSAQNPPDFVFAVVRDSGTWSLANAFSHPVKTDGDLVEDSIAALVDYWGKLSKAYGINDIKAKPVVAVRGSKFDGLDRVNSVDDLVAAVNAAIAVKK